MLVLNGGIDHLHSKHDIHKEEEAMVVVGPLRGCIFFVVASSVCFDGWLERVLSREREKRRREDFILAEDLLWVSKC